MVFLTRSECPGQKMSRSKNVPVKKCPSQTMSRSKICPGRKSVPVKISHSKYHIQNIPIRVSKSKYTGQKYDWVKKCPGQNITFKISRFKIRLRSICQSKFNFGQYFSLYIPFTFQNIPFKIRLRSIFSV